MKLAIRSTYDLLGFKNYLMSITAEWHNDYLSKVLALEGRMYWAEIAIEDLLKIQYLTFDLCYAQLCC